MLKVSGFGRLAQDPQLIEVGKSIKSYFTIVWTEVRNNKDRDISQNIQHFIDCELWDTAADYFYNNFVKDDKIYIDGILRQERWEKDGQNKSKTVIRITHFEKIEERK
jgi:single-strand DNA-binding protein